MLDPTEIGMYEARLIGVIETLEGGYDRGGLAAEREALAKLLAEIETLQGIVRGLAPIHEEQS